MQCVHSCINANCAWILLPDRLDAWQVVYLPTCVTRMMGPSLPDKERASVHEKLLSIFHKADYEVIYPEVSCPHTRGSMLHAQHHLAYEAACNQTVFSGASPMQHEPMLCADWCA